MSASATRSQTMTKSFVEIDGRKYSFKELAAITGKSTEALRAWARRGYLVEVVEHALKQK